MRPGSGPAARTVLRAGLFGAGVIGGYLLLSLFASPAQADDGIDLGEVVADLRLPVVDPPDTPAEPVAEPGTDPVVETVTDPVVEVVEQAGPAADGTTGTTVELPETLTGTTVDPTEEITDAASGIAAGTPVAAVVAAAGGSVDQLIAGVDQTVGSTLDPLASTVDSVLPGVAPIVDGVADQLLTPPPDPLAGPAPEPVAGVGAAPDPGIGEPVPAGLAPGPPVPAGLAPGPPVPAVDLATAGQPPGTAAAATGGDQDPAPVRLPGPPSVSTGYHPTGDSFDPGQQAWLPTAAHQPDPGQLRSLEDITYAGLVMPVSVRPG